jgi:putative ABC transport system permease protein
VLAEALVLGLVGGIVGGAAAYLTFDGFTASTLNFQTFSQLSFSFRVTPQVLASGIGYGLLLSLIGGIGPGLRAARQPVTEGLRA